MIRDKNQQRAEISAYFQLFDEAEALFASMDRFDLSLAMRIKLGDWFKVEKMLRAGDKNNLTHVVALNNIGNYFFERQKWDRAALYYFRSNNLRKLIDCYYLLEEYKELEKVVSITIGNNEMLSNIGSMFCGAGMCSQAIHAYISSSDITSAIDACVLLNHWDSAFSLVKEHNCQMTASDNFQQLNPPRHYCTMLS